MEDVDIRVGAARVNVTPTWPHQAVADLREAVRAVCRAIDTAESRQLAADVTPDDPRS